MNQRSTAAIKKLLELVPPPWDNLAKARLLEVLDAFIEEVDERMAARRREPEGTE